MGPKETRSTCKATDLCGTSCRYLPFIVNRKKGEKLIFGKFYCCVKSTNAVNIWLGVSKEEGDKCVHAICEFMSDTATSLKFEGENVYDAFKKSTHSNGIDMTEYKYMFDKALKS
eukprot:9660365-Ditylum_brightwellii.AAC.1